MQVKDFKRGARLRIIAKVGKGTGSLKIAIRLEIPLKITDPKNNFALLKDTWGKCQATQVTLKVTRASKSDVITVVSQLYVSQL